MKNEKIKKSAKDMPILDLQVNGKRTHAFLLSSDSNYDAWSSNITQNRLLYFPEHHKLMMEVRVAKDETGVSLTPISRTLVLLSSNTIMKDLDDEDELEDTLHLNVQSLENEIWEVYSEGKRCPINNEDWTDAHQEYLEYMEFKEELDARYQDAQNKLIEYLNRHSMQHRLTVRTAKEYYDKQKQFEEDCRELELNN